MMFKIELSDSEFEALESALNIVGSFQTKDLAERFRELREKEVNRLEAEKLYLEQRREREENEQKVKHYDSSHHKDAIDALKVLKVGNELRVTTRFDSAGSLEVLAENTGDDACMLLGDIESNLGLEQSDASFYDEEAFEWDRFLVTPTWYESYWSFIFKRIK